MFGIVVFAVSVVLTYFVAGVASINLALAWVTLALLLVMIAVSYARKRPAGLLVKYALIVAAAAAVVQTANAADKRHARRASAGLISAAERYKADTGAYPANLEDLRPKYIAKVPRARYTVTNGQYILRPGRLYYYVDPTMLAEEYDFAAGTWSLRAASDIH